MNALPENWLTEGLLDAEYKKYVILAYLKQVREHFGERKLYPILPDLQGHYQRSQDLRSQQADFQTQFRRRLTGLDLRTFQLRYETLLPDDACSATLDEILDFALPRFAQTETEGRELDEEVDANLTISPVGLLPLVRTEGYLLVDEPTRRETRVYQYRLTFFDNTRPPRRRMQTDHLETLRRGYATTHEHLKLDLLRRYRHLPNPATFAVESRRVYPLEETLLPVAKRKVSAWLE